LVLVFDFVQSVGHSVTADGKRAGSGDEIAISVSLPMTEHVLRIP